MKQQQLFTATLAIFVLTALAIPSVLAAQSGSFSVTATVGNNAPTISAVNGGFSLTPTEDATGYYQFSFNATDINGGTDINQATATVIVNQSGTSITSTACTGSVAGNDVVFNCSVGLPYYYSPGTWSINASVRDLSNAYVQNTTQTYTWNTLKAIQLTLASLSFSGSSNQADVAATEGAQFVRNTGNYNFVQLNVTGINLNASSNSIGAGNFSVNVTNSALGQALVNNTAVTVASFALNAGLNSNSSLYFYLDVPTVPSGTYTSASNWVVDVN